MLKQEPDEDGPRNIQKVPSLSDLSDPEASLGESFTNNNYIYLRKMTISIVLKFTYEYQLDVAVNLKQAQNLCTIIFNDQFGMPFNMIF